MNETERGTGRTTEQMRTAPANAVFIWCNGVIDYPRRLARFLGRPDLMVVSPAAATDWRSYPHFYKRPVVLDHALVPDERLLCVVRDVFQNGVPAL